MMLSAQMASGDSKLQLRDNGVIDYIVIIVTNYTVNNKQYKKSL